MAGLNLLSAIPGLAALKRQRQDRATLEEAYASGGLAGASDAAASIGMPGLAMNYDSLAGSREDRARAKFERDSLAHAFATDGLEGATRIAANMGNPELAGGFENLRQSQEGFKMVKASKERREFGQWLTAGLSGEPEADLAFLNRALKARPEMFKNALAIEGHRIPTAIELSEGPDGQMVYTMDMYNAKTKSIGPATENASAEPGDNVIAVSPERLQRIAQVWAAGEDWDPLAAKTSKRGGQWRYNDKLGGFFNQDTAQFKKLPDDPREFMGDVREHIDNMADTGGAMNFDINDKRRYTATLNEVADAALAAGLSSEGIMAAVNAAGGVLTTENEFAGEILRSEDTASREQAMLALYQHIGLLEAAPAEGPDERGSVVEAMQDQQKKDPRATMPRSDAVRARPGARGKPTPTPQSLGDATDTPWRSGRGPGKRSGSAAGAAQPHPLGNVPPPDVPLRSRRRSRDSNGEAPPMPRRVPLRDSRALR